MSAKDGAIRLVDLTKTYPFGEGNSLTLFSSLNLDIPAGQRLAIVGQSGAGKSSLLYLIGGLDTPSSGAIYFGQTEITALGDAARARFRNREIGFVWQTYHLMPEFTALENVMMPLLIGGALPQSALPQAMDRLEEVGLAGRAGHRPGQLSGGEQQRVALARALIHQPPVLLADEPTGNLDARTGSIIMDLVERIAQARRLTLVLVTHNLCFAKRCDRILKLEGGVVADMGIDDALLDSVVTGR